MIKVSETGHRAWRATTGQNQHELAREPRERFREGRGVAAIDELSLSPGAVPSATSLAVTVVEPKTVLSGSAVMRRTLIRGDVALVMTVV